MARLLATTFLSTSLLAGCGDDDAMRFPDVGVSGDAATVDAGPDAATDGGGLMDAGGNINPVDDDTLEVLAQYPVDGDLLVGDVDPGHLAIWERFAELFPAALRPEVNLFVAIDVEASGGTDGAMQVSAANPEDYYLALDVTGGVTMADLERTMVHEFAHLLTLRPSQIPRDPSTVGECPVYAESEGCPTEEAYVYAYYEMFWPDYFAEDLEMETDSSAADARFATGEFVTEYAATIPGEDVAEVFAEWVYADTPPVGDEVIDQKLRYFDGFPEVVAIRTQVRGAL